MAEAFDPYYTWLGIPPEEQPADYYRLLGVRRYESNTDVINNAADQRMAHIRTFQSGKRSAESQKLLNELAAAVVCLVTPQKRADYDAKLRAQETAQRAASQMATPPYAAMPPAWSAPPPLAQTLPMAEPVNPSLMSPQPALAPVAVRASGRSSKRSGLMLFVSLLAALAFVAVGAGMWMLNQNSKPEPIASVNPLPSSPPVTPESGQSSQPQPQTPAPLVSPGDPANAQTKPDNPGAGSETKTESGASSASPSSPQGDARTEWRYHAAGRGAFKLTENGWRLVRPDKPDEAWEEVARTPKYVEIKEPKTGLLMRLQEDKFTRSTDGRTWVGSAAGAWVASASNVAASPEKPAGEASRYSPDFAQHIPNNSRAVEILPAINPEAHRLSGVVERQGSDLRLATTPQDTLAKLRLPVRPPPAYVLELDFTPISPGTGTLAVGLVVDGKPCTFQIDSFPKNGWYSGLELIQRKRVIFLTEPLVVKGRQTTNNERTHVAILVQPRRVLAEINGKRVTTWEGDPSDFSQVQEHAFSDGSLGLTSVRADVTLHSIKVTPLAETPLASSPPATADPPSLPPSDSPAAPIVSRKAVPPEEELEAAKQRLKAAFGADVAKAVKSPEKVALAKQLLEAAKNEPSDSVRYVVLQAARRLAIGGDNVELALSLATDLSSQFEVDKVSLLAETISDLAKADLLIAEQEKLADAALKAAREALENEQAEEADALSLVAQTVANRAKDPARRKAAKAMRDEAVRYKQVFQDYQAARELLSVDENDAKSNLVVGKFLCFERQDWIRGREHLAKSSDEKLAAAARLEDAAASGSELLAAADAWFALRGSFSGRDKRQLDRHAADLYELASQDLNGLDQSKANNRVEELKTALAAADKAAAETGAVQTTSRKAPIKYIEGIMVRAFVRNQGTEIPTPYVCNVKDYSQMPDTEIRTLVSDAYSRSATLYGFGYLVLEQDAEVAIRLDGCTCRLGTELLSAMGGSQLQEQRSLKKGTYPVVFTFRTDAFNRPHFSLKDAASGANLLYFNEKEWLAEQAKPVPVPGRGIVRSQVVETR